MNNLQFDFLPNKEKKTLTIKREFEAARQLVWDCYTKSELLDQWFAPKTFTNKTKSMDFRNGGHWHFAMIDPDGNNYWNWMDYTNIKSIDSFEALDAFSTEGGEINSEMPRAKWQITFSSKCENTIVESVIQYKLLADLEAVLDMGKGMVDTFEKLDKLILTLKK